MSKKCSGRGGKREGAGRKAVDGVKNTVCVMVSLTQEHHEKFKKLGGSAWLRSIIDEKYGTEMSMFPAQQDE